jgi:hypothetical protein
MEQPVESLSRLLVREVFAAIQGLLAKLNRFNEAGFFREIPADSQPVNGRPGYYALRGKCNRQLSGKHGGAWLAGLSGEMLTPFGMRSGTGTFSSFRRRILCVRRNWEIESRQSPEVTGTPLSRHVGGELDNFGVEMQAK